MPGKPTEIVMPLSGVDRGASLAAQPPGTCFDALNVRGFDLTDRKRVGKRSGMKRALSQVAGASSSTRRVSGLAMLSKARGTPSASGGALELITDTFSAYAVAAPADLGENYNAIEWNNDTVFAQIAVFGVLNSGVEGAVTTAPTALGSRLTFSHRFTNADGRGQAGGLQFAYATDNDVTVYIEANRTCTAIAADGWGAASQAWGVGPCIMGRNTTGRYLTARLRKTALNAFVLEIIDYNGNTGFTVVATSAGQVNINSAVLGLLNIRLYTAGANVTAVLNWADNAIAGLTLSAAIPAGVVGNVRSGVMVTTTTNGGGMGVGAVNAYRIINKVVFSRLVPDPPTVYLSASGTTPSPGGNFYVPDSWRSIGRDTNTALGVPTVQNGPFESAGLPAFPYVDDADNRLEGKISADPGPAGAGTYGVFADGLTRTERLGVDFTIIPNQSGAGPTSPSGGAAFRIADDSSAMVYARLKLTCSATTQATGCAQISSITECQIVSGSQFPTENSVYPAGGNLIYIIREDARLRWTDDGTTIRLYVNGINLFSFTPGAWALTAGPAGATINNNLRCGVGIPGYGSAAALTFACLTDARIISGEASPTINTAETDPKILVITAGDLQVADLANDSLVTTVGANVLTGAVPIATSLNLKWYCVDGTTAGGVIVDPILLTNQKWTATLGTAPWDDASLGACRMVCTYRGRVVVARAVTNSGFWAMTRVGAPTDFDYGSSTSPSTKAYVGTNADVGQPADTITALIPYSDDYLIFGCANSIWMLEGDPGYGGAVQNVSYRTGMLGPRAWCFDESGNLYFMGSAGLYKMAKGTRDPIPVGERKLVGILDRVDASTTLVEMVYDAFKGAVHIFLTPGDGLSAGTHVVYGTKDQSWWLDQFPLYLGPWSVCELVGAEDEDRRWLIGGNDGYLRRPNDDTPSDDATSTGAVADITAKVRLGPIFLANQRLECLISEIQFIGAQGSGPFQWYLLTGDSAEEVMRQDISAAVVSGTVVTVADYGFQEPIGIRSAGGCHAIELRQVSASESIRLESVMAAVEATSRRRL